MYALRDRGGALGSDPSPVACCTEKNRQCNWFDWQFGQQGWCFAAVQPTQPPFGCPRLVLAAACKPWARPSHTISGTRKLYDRVGMGVGPSLLLNITPDVTRDGRREVESYLGLLAPYKISVIIDIVLFFSTFFLLPLDCTFHLIIAVVHPSRSHVAAQAPRTLPSFAARQSAALTPRSCPPQQVEAAVSQGVSSS